ncbi:hypothetical protein ALC53_06320, partial [Atta colombica]
VGIGKKNHIWVPPDDKVGDHAGSLIASMAIDLATKSSPKFKYTHKSLASPGLVSTRTLQHLWYPDVVVTNVLDVPSRQSTRIATRRKDDIVRASVCFVIENAHSSISDSRVKSE